MGMMDRAARMEPEIAAREAFPDSVPSRQISSMLLDCLLEKYQVSGSWRATRVMHLLSVGLGNLLSVWHCSLAQSWSHSTPPVSVKPTIEQYSARDINHKSSTFSLHIQSQIEAGARYLCLARSVILMPVLATEGSDASKSGWVTLHLLSGATGSLNQFLTNTRLQIAIELR
jgi:hypothetical protein